MRSLRILREGAIYQVSARINRKEMAMKPDTIKDLFLEIVLRSKKKYSYELLNFSIMDNHFHFLIKPDEGENLSKIMQWILSRFATAYNRRLGISGHLWGERFFSRIVESAEELIAIFGYIDDNPVLAGLIARIEDWKYSGIAHHRAGLFSIVTRPTAWILSCFPSHQQLISTS
jgi:putative transposase